MGDLDGSTSLCGGGNDDNKLCIYNVEPSLDDSQPNCGEVKEDILGKENLVHGEAKIRNLDEQNAHRTCFDEDNADKQPNLQGRVEVIETVSIIETIIDTNSGVHSENLCLTAQKESTRSSKIHDSPISGAKRARSTYELQQPSVHVSFNSLSRQSKKKLEELLLQWSEWEGQQCSLSEDSNGALECGEKTYFPAFHVGSEKSYTVSFSMDNRVMKRQKQSIDISLDGDTAPLYDRGFALGLTSVDDSINQEGSLEILNAAPRCFNCESYNHSLKDCPKPRDNAAVNTARKQRQANKNNTSSSRNPTRYYQATPGGKYDGLIPGVLSAETRQLLGLGELDPPPWFNRMRELGYPPGYLDPEEDTPSGITIYADEGEQDGEIQISDLSTPKKKFSVKFPGINAAIPVNAEPRKWAASPVSSGPPIFDNSRSRSNPRSNYSSEFMNHGYDPMRSRENRSVGSSGYNIGVSPPVNYNYTSDPRTPSLERSLSDRGWRSPMVHAGLSSYRSPYDFVPHSSPNAWRSPQNAWQTPQNDAWNYHARLY